MTLLSQKPKISLSKYIGANELIFSLSLLDHTTWVGKIPIIIFITLNK